VLPLSVRPTGSRKSKGWQIRSFSITFWDTFKREERKETASISTCAPLPALPKFPFFLQVKFM
jgi:hypothetical protein